MYISRRSPVSTLLLSCVPGGGMKSSYRWARPLSKKAQGDVDGLLGAVSKLSLCRSTRSAVGICFTISDRRRTSKYIRHIFENNIPLKILPFICFIHLLILTTSTLPESQMKHSPTAIDSKLLMPFSSDSQYHRWEWLVVSISCYLMIPTADCVPS